MIIEHTAKGIEIIKEYVKEISLFNIINQIIFKAEVGPKLFKNSKNLASLLCL